MSLSGQSALVNKGTYHLSVLLLTKYSMDTDIPMIVVNIPSLRFVGLTTKTLITGNFQGV